MYSNLLKQLREENKLTQQNVADILNISESCYRHYENADDIIPLKHLNELCNHFKVSIDYILRFTNSKQYKMSKKEINIEKFKIRLKEFRKENKLTQAKLAIKINSTQSNIAEYEKGTRIISTPFLYTICKKYQISADYLLGKIDEPQYLK